ncbi:MAG: hypothetical protein CM15mP49_33850 [Actinomycetota bacterium]|nr:MAG: hypothetical protein CM15mP49_33850 [Actinomycetota bacterium]
MMKKIKDIYHDAYWELQETSYAEVKQSSKRGPKRSSVKQTRRISNSAEYFVEYLDQHPMLIFVFGKQGGESTTFPVLWNLCLAARAEGLGTFITTLLKLRKQEVEQLLGMPEGFWHMHAMIPIGYPTGRWGTASRKPANELFIQKLGITQSHGPVSQTGQNPRTTDATTNKRKRWISQYLRRHKNF